MAATSQAMAPKAVVKRSRRRGELRGWRLLAAQCAFFAGLLVLWHVAAVAGLYPVVARTPAEVWRAFLTIAQEGELGRNTWATLMPTLVAFGLSAVVGVVSGLSLALLPTVERIVNPLLDALNTAPRIALAPVFIVIFGISSGAKIALAFSLAVFMVIMAARAGVRGADPDVIRLSVVMGATRRQRFVKVLLPMALPSIFSGLRLALIYSLLGVVTCELISSRDGLGAMIATYSSTFGMDRVYAIAIMLIVIATTLNALMGWIDRRLLGGRQADVS